MTIPDKSGHFARMKREFPSAWISLVFLSLAGVAGFVLGRLTLLPEAPPIADVPEARRSVLTGPNIPASQARPTGESASWNELGVDWSWHALPSRGPARQEAITRQMEQVLGFTSPTARLATFLAFFQHYLPEDHQSVITAFNKHDQQGRLFPREYELFIQRCVAVEGEAAVNRMFQKDDKEKFHPSGWQLEAIAEWSGKQGTEAVAWWNKLPEGVLRDSLAKPLIEGLARQDPAAAWKSALLFPAGERSRFAGVMIRQHLTNGGVTAAAAWIESLKNSAAEEIPGVQAKAVASLYQSTFLIPTQQRAEAMLPFMSEPWFAESGVGQGLTGEWAMKDPAAAGAWLKANVPESIRQPMLDKVVERLRKAAPDKALQFESALGPSDTSAP